MEKDGWKIAPLVLFVDDSQVARTLLKQELSKEVPKRKVEMISLAGQKFEQTFGL